MKISTLIDHLNLIKEAHGDIPVWVEVDYVDYDDNASRRGPIMYEPLVQHEKGITILVLWADA